MKSKTILAFFLIFFVLFVVLRFGLGEFRKRTISTQIQETYGQKLEIDTESFARLITLHQIKAPPGPYDWLSMHKEPGQTFDDYVKLNPLKPNQGRPYIYLTLMGEFDDKRKEIIDRTIQCIEGYFQMPVKMLAPVSLFEIPALARRKHPDTGDKQILTTYVLENVLRPKLPDDAYCLIAFTTSDLWPGEGWNFVFGQASIVDRVGVWSIARNGDPNKSEEDYRYCLRRTVKTGTHEVGHMFSLHHCIYYECAMNGSNHRKESDRRPLYLCPVCLRKLAWLVDFNIIKRYQDLMKLSEQLDFNDDKDFYKASIEALKN